MTTPKDVPKDMKERLKASYDAMAPEYNEWTRDDFALRLRYLNKLFTYSKKLATADTSPSVVELGCGSGHPILTILVSRNPTLTVTANDMSSTQLELAKKRLHDQSTRVNFVLGDMMGMSLAPESQTAVVALYSIIHLPQNEQAIMLGRIAAWLEPGGYMLANFAIEKTDGVIMEDWLSDKGWMFWSGLGVDETMKKIKSAGLELIETKIEEGYTQEKFLWVIAQKPRVSSV